MEHLSCKCKIDIIPALVRYGRRSDSRRGGLVGPAMQAAVTGADEGDIDGVHEDTCGYIVSQGKQGVNESFDWVLGVYYPRLASRSYFRLCCLV